MIGGLSMNVNQMIKKIMIWGDSVFKGITLDAAGKYRVLEKNCGALVSKESGVEIINRSRFGCTVTKGHSIMTADLGRNQKPDAAIIEFGGNDCDFDWAQIAAAPDAEHLPKTPLTQFVGEVQSMIDETRGNGIEPILTTLPPLEPNRFFATISKGLDARAILHWLGDVFRTYRWQEGYSNAVASLACKNNCKLVDLRGAFLMEKDYGRLICEDGMHPNAEGHRLMANVMDQFLAQGL